MDDADPVAFHLPLETYSRSYDSGVNPKSGGAPKMTVNTDGAHLVVVTLRESPGVFLDKVEFVGADGNVVASVEAEDTSEAAADALAALPDKSFFIKGDGASSMFQSTRLNHKRQPIRYLHQAFAGRLEAGEAISNQALLYNTDATEAADYDLRRINTDAAVLMDGGGALGVVAAGAGSLTLPPELATDAALAFLVCSHRGHAHGNRVLWRDAAHRGRDRVDRAGGLTDAFPGGVAPGAGGDDRRCARRDRQSADPSARGHADAGVVPAAGHV
jgi:hypothetical protein